MIGLDKILTPKKKGIQYWLTVAGILIGLTTSILVIVLTWDIKSGAEAESDVFSENTIVIQKEVSRLTSLGLNETSFSDEEILAIEQKQFVIEVASFKTANYEVGMSENPGDGLPGFYAEMFLQSVPNAFLSDLDTSAWFWQSEADVVPIILPRDFLTLVNYGIAPSKGMPQISEELIKSVRLRLHLIGAGTKGVVLGRVVGFSSKIASVLVPETFIDYSNRKYGFKRSANPSRLFLRTKPDSFSEMNQLVKEMNLVVSQNELSMAKITTYLIQMISLFFAFSFIILVLSVLALMQYLQMTLFQFQYELSLLIKLGYEPKLIIASIRKRFLKILLTLSGIALVGVLLIKTVVIEPFMIAAGMETNYFGYIFGMLFVFALLITVTVILKKSVLGTILKIYKKA